MQRSQQWVVKVQLINNKHYICWTSYSKYVCSQYMEWGWGPPDSSGTSWVVVSEDKKQVTFHPFFSTGTAAAEGDTPLHHSYHYYWKVKILTETYGADIMVGLATNKVSTSDSQFKFVSLLGREGAVRHDATVSRDSAGFCRGSIVGVRVHMCHGTLEFYVNRKPHGVSFYNLRRHGALYLTVYSTAARSSTRLIYAGSWRASLFGDVAKIMAASVNNTQERLLLGILYTCRSQFWLTLPSEGCEERDTSYSESLVLDL